MVSFVLLIKVLNCIDRSSLKRSCAGPRTGALKKLLMLRLLQQTDETERKLNYLQHC